MSEQKVGDDLAGAAAGPNGRHVGSSCRFESLLGDPERSLLAALAAVIENSLSCSLT